MRLILEVRLSDSVNISELLKKQEWLSVSLNKMMIESIALEAWKTVHFDINPKETRSASRADFNSVDKHCSKFVNFSAAILN